MSEDWKNDSAEASMRAHEAEMMLKFKKERESQIITKTWTVTAVATGPNAESLMSDFEGGLVGLDSHVNKIDGVDVNVMPESNEDDDEIQ